MLFRHSQGLGITEPEWCGENANKSYGGIPNLLLPVISPRCVAQDFSELLFVWAAVKCRSVNV